MEDCPTAMDLMYLSATVIMMDMQSLSLAAAQCNLVSAEFYKLKECVS